MTTPSTKACSRPPRIVLTGGPGGGKTTAADLFRREIGERIVIVPEAATMLFGGGFPRAQDTAGIHASQQAIYHVQRNLEHVQSACYPDRILLCDRGTLDGAAYWPGGPDGFFEALDTTRDRELARYDAVLFFETAALGGLQIEGGNPVRTESLQQAVALNDRLLELYRHHPRFVVVRHEHSFIRKITMALDALDVFMKDLTS